MEWAEGKKDLVLYTNVEITTGMFNRTRNTAKTHNP